METKEKPIKIINLNKCSCGLGKDYCNIHNPLPDSKPLEVSDWSQPIKIALMVIFMLGAASFAVQVLHYLKEIVINTQ